MTSVRNSVEKILVSEVFLRRHFEKTKPKIESIVDNLLLTLASTVNKTEESFDKNITLLWAQSGKSRPIAGFKCEDFELSWVFLEPLNIIMYYYIVLCTTYEHDKQTSWMGQRYNLHNSSINKPEPSNCLLVTKTKKQRLRRYRTYLQNGLIWKKKKCRCQYYPVPS